MSKTIILAAGGTGGHIFPAEALAEVLLARGYTPELITDHRFHDYNKLNADAVLSRIPIHTIRAGSPSGGILKIILNGVGLLVGIVQAVNHLRRIRPVAVVGFGGYPSFPTMVAAILLRKTTIIHEQNSVLGRVNRLAARFVNHIAVSYRNTQFMPVKAGLKTTRTGNPVRSAIQALAKIEYPHVELDGMLKILVIGGSQGASVFSDVVPKAFEKLSPQLRARVRLDQQCRVREIEHAKAAYQAMGMQVDIAPFFADVAARLAGAHLVISRAGASSVAELTAAGRPAILVPLPAATDNHQYFNAEAVEDAGGGWVMAQDGFTADALAAKLETFLRVPKTLAEAAANMKPLGQPDAADGLANLVLNVAGVENVASEREKLENAA
ncbi:MAG: undecaprenyldiphospho-muramoylpentapeptide beta-N-acetylglucosaminyltransferase [Alphaproteobacteria bacterium]|nr:undecaprenyldiphospho-muramoylpentapeptide beta-N-acetylglucosaminyltransferase [Alphaproteobacteria bacterium]